MKKSHKKEKVLKRIDNMLGKILLLNLDFTISFIGFKSIFFYIILPFLADICVLIVVYKYVLISNNLDLGYYYYLSNCNKIIYLIYLIIIMKIPYSVQKIKNFYIFALWLEFLFIMYLIG